MNTRFDELMARSWERGLFPTNGEVAAAGLSTEDHYALVCAALDGATRNSKAAHAESIKAWAGDRPARHYFLNSQPANEAQRRNFDEIEAAIAIVEDHYEQLDATPSNPLQVIKINPTKGDVDGSEASDVSYSAGIRIYRHAYADHEGTVHVAGIVGPHNVCIEGSGARSVQLEPGARTFMRKVSFRDGPPTREQMIDDLCVLPLAESRPPVKSFMMDLGTFPAYATARDLQAELIQMTGVTPADRLAEQKVGRGRRGTTPPRLDPATPSAPAPIHDAPAAPASFPAEPAYAGAGISHSEQLHLF
jgi:hypothetical protein